MSNSKALQPASQALEPFRHALAKAQAHFKLALPSTVARYLTPERMTKITLAALSRTPLLLQCTPESVLRSVMDAAALGLEPSGGVLGHAYLVPYRNNKTGRYEAQLIVGYRGLIDLARRSGQIASVEAHVVYEADEFEIEFGRDPRLMHKPSFAPERGGIIAAYVVAQLKDGAKHCEFMTIAEIEEVRSRSRARDNGPWRTDYAEMCRKTVVRRAAKYWPLSAELSSALDIEARAEDGGDYEIAELPSEPEQTAPAQLEQPTAEAQAEGAAPNEDAPADAHDYGPPPWSDSEGESEPATSTQRVLRRAQTSAPYRAGARK